MNKKRSLIGCAVMVAMFFSSYKVSEATSLFSLNVQGSSTAQVGQKSSYSFSVIDNGGNENNVIISVEIDNASGAKIFQQSFTGQNFATGQTQSHSVLWTPSSAGADSIQVEVLNSNGTSVLWQEKVLAVQVVPVPQFSLSVSLPQSATTGHTAQIGFDVRDTVGTVSNVIIELEVDNASGAKVFQQSFTGQNFATGQTQSHSVLWTPSIGGTYKVDVGVFSADLSKQYYWGSDAATFTVAGQNPPLGFYVDPVSSALAQAATWQSSDPADAARMKLIGSQPQATWFGDWNSNVTADVSALTSAAQTAGKIPVLVAYNIPDRDCGGYSAGGAQTPDAYQAWIQAFAQGIGSRPATVILEPDALASMDCMSITDQATRLSLLTFAVQTLRSLGNTKVYLDAGNSDWIDAVTMAARLQKADVAQANGFSLNVANFYTTASNALYGAAISALVGGKHFVIDTSRNGDGSNGQWCNPSGRALGAFPTTATGNSLIDAYLWIKVPGESDGTCNGGPSAGTWWPQYAAGLAATAGY
jgi:endoglucanase